MNDQHMTLLLHGDSYTDKSMYQQTVTNINCTIADNFGKFGNKSFYFDGVNSRLQLPNLITGNQPFTIDLWFYGVSQKNNTIWSHGGTNTQMGTGGGVEFFGDTTIIYYCNGFLISGMAPVSLNTWHHLAIVGDGVSVTLYLDGQLYGTVGGYAYTFSNVFETIGANDSAYGVENFAGYMDEIRFSDTVRWTSNFTPPTEPYPDAEPGTYISKIEVNGRTLIDLTSDTVDDNAVLSGITFHKKSGEIATGTIPSLGAQTISPTTAAQTITSGQYLSGNQTISAITKELLASLDADFVAGNIKKDVDLFGLMGTLEGGGGGGTIHGHKFIAGSFTLASGMTSTYTVISASDLFDGIKDDFPGATKLSDSYYTRTESEKTSLLNFLAGICWLDEIDVFSTDLNANEWVASFFPRYSLSSVNNLLAYGNGYGTFTVRSGSTNGFRIGTNGATIGFSSSYQGYAGRRYKYLIYALDHGAKF